MITSAQALCAMHQLDTANIVLRLGFACDDCPYCETHGCEECDHRGVVEISAEVWQEISGCSNEWFQELNSLVSTWETECREAQDMEH